MDPKMKPMPQQQQLRITPHKMITPQGQLLVDAVDQKRSSLTASTKAQDTIHLTRKGYEPALILPSVKG